MPLLVGTSGWQYRDWRGPVYRPGLPQARWLEDYAARFATVEVNNAFYRLPSAETFAAWAARTPPDFVFVVKASRFLTHVRRLRDPAGPVDLFAERARRLGPKLGPVLVQLPPTLQADVGRLEETLAAFARHGIRVAVEPRHPSWWVPAVRAALERHGAALSWADRLSRPAAPLWRTADWGYLRLHEGDTPRRPCYSRSTLETWVGRIEAGFPDAAEVYVYFNNDPRGCAVHDAALFAQAAGRRGRTATRTPPSRTVVPLAAEPAR